MSDTTLFVKCATAVDALQRYFGSTPEALYAHETIGEYVLTVAVEREACREADAATGEHRSFTLEQDLPDLAGAMLPAGFLLTLEMIVHDYKVTLNADRDAGAVQFTCTKARGLNGGMGDGLPPDKVAPFEHLQETLEEGTKGIPLETLCDLLDDVAGEGVRIDLSLRVYLHKGALNRAIERMAGDGAAIKPVTYLFPQALVEKLDTLDVAGFERELTAAQRRTVIVVVGFEGWLSSDVLTLAGRDGLAQLADVAGRALDGALLEHNAKTRDFRRAQSSWANPTEWLTPDTFHLHPPAGTLEGVGAELEGQLRSFQALLSAIYLADSVDAQEDEYAIAFRGVGRSRFVVRRAALRERAAASAQALYALYAYAYDGFSADKLQIAQHFMSLTAKDAASLCDSAVEVRDATVKTYGQVLAGKVEEYFDARQKVQERVKTAVGETAEAVIDLTREVSGDLYKVAGVLLAALAGALIKPEISAWAFLGAAIVIALYLCLVLFVHLPTVKQAYRLRTQQHARYIRSFHDALRAQEIESALGDEQMGKAEDAFAHAYRKVYAAYAGMLLLTGLFAYGAILALLRSISSP